MQHLDEGTIHAWLDGALDAAQSREIEAHLAQCATCSAAVAEARGLVAASSRILTALDDVPGGVLPKRVAPTVVKPAKRQWRAAPWVSGIAATLLVALGVTTLAKRTDLSAPLNNEVATVRSVAPAADSALIAPAVPRAQEASNVATLQPRPTAPVARRDAAAKAGLADAPRNVAADVAAGGGAGVQAAKLESAPAAVAAAPEAPAARQLNRPATKSLALDAVVATAAPEGSDKKSAEEMETARFAGCYRIQPADRSLTERVASATAGAVGRVAGESRARASAAAPSAASGYTAPLPPALVRLDTLRQPLGYVVRDAYTNGSVGNWRGVGDSARVDLLTAGLYRVALTQRTACP